MYTLTSKVFGHNSDFKYFKRFVLLQGLSAFSLLFIYWPMRYNQKFDFQEFKTTNWYGISRHNVLYTYFVSYESPIPLNHRIF